MTTEIAKPQAATPSQVTVKDLHLTNQPLDNFVKGVLNRPVPENDVRVNRMANNANYIPISFVETKLDEVFFGLWSIENFQSKIVANEIVGSIELKVFHPIAKVWLTRTGVGSVVIQQNTWELDSFGNPLLDKDNRKIKAPKPKPSDVDAKILNTLVKDFPHLKAECVKNAAKSLGVWFGRDLNRKDADFYESDLKAVANTARMPTPAPQVFKAVLEKIENIGLSVLPDIRNAFTFTPEQEKELAELERNLKAKG